MIDGADLFRLDGAVAIVTGATGWLGGPMVSALASAGATVYAVSRTPSGAPRPSRSGATVRRTGIFLRLRLRRSRIDSRRPRTASALPT